MFEQVSLSKNGWHAKLQRWTFGKVPLAGKTWAPFASVGSFFAMYFKTFKENHCPPIEWE
jgi:hypothetical protein